MKYIEGGNFIFIENTLICTSDLCLENFLRGRAGKGDEIYLDENGNVKPRGFSFGCYQCGKEIKIFE